MNQKINSELFNVKLAEFINCFYASVRDDSAATEDNRKQLDFEIAIDQAVFDIQAIRSRLYVLLDYIINHAEKTNRALENHEDYQFADNILVAVRDLRGNVIDLEESLLGKLHAKS